MHLGQVLFVVANDRKSKLQADIRSSGAPDDVSDYIIRAVHGHSTALLAQIESVDAFQQVWPYACIHATYSHLLPNILGRTALALYQGAKRGLGTLGTSTARRSYPLSGPTSRYLDSAEKAST